MENLEQEHRLTTLEILLDQSNKTQSRLTEVLDHLEKTIILFESRLEQHTTDIAEIKKNLKKDDDEKSINIMSLLKSNMLTIVLLFVLIAQHLGLIK